MPTNGSAARHLPDWIATFVEQTSNLHAPRIFRTWVGLSILAAALELKVWIQTSSPQYPNLYTFLIGHPGTGKSRTVAEGRKLLMKLPDFFLAPISLTFASMIDALEKSKRSIIRQPEGEVTYNTLFLCVDEMRTFIHKYDPEMISGLSHFYDPAAYQQDRRGREHKTRIECALLNMLTGATPQDLLSFMPENAWGQGFTSRSIMIFSDERIIGDDFAPKVKPPSDDLLHDLKVINSLYGEFTVTEAYRAAINQWRALGEPPTPDHPKLTHYITRRKVHIYKLSMLASVNRSGGLVLTEADFLQALEWLVEAETHMPDIFKAGAMNADAGAMDEIQHYVRINDLGTGVSEQRIVHFARERVPITSILRIIEIMEGAGQIVVKRIDKKTGARYFSSAPIRTSLEAAADVSPPPGPAPPPPREQQS
jgi:hypothetical protein